MPSPEKHLKDLGITLPKPARPVASYEGFVRSGNLVYVSGQIRWQTARLPSLGNLAPASRSTKARGPPAFAPST